MTIDRRKTLETARRFAQRGAREKALGQYATLLRLDPNDTRLRLELGDVHRRWGGYEQATTHYSRVAEQFRSEGFEARAAAVWKRVLQLDAKRYEAHVALSELYQHLGQRAQAIDSLQTGIDGLHQEGRTREALELLRRMGQLDPANTVSRIKVADLLAQEELIADAAMEYEEIIVEFERVDDFDSIPSIYERLIELKPECISTHLALARAWLRLDRFTEAESTAQALLSLDRDSVEAYKVLCESFRHLGRDSEMAEASRRLAELYRERGDHEQATGIAQRLPGSDELDLASESESLMETGEAPLDFGFEDIEGCLFEASGATGDVPVDSVELELELELELDEEGEGATELEMTPGPMAEEGQSEVVEPGPNAMGSAGPRVPLTVGAVELEIEIDVPAESTVAEEPRSRDSVPVEESRPPSVGEDLEEARFYLEQGLHEEAQAVVTRVLSAVPDHSAAGRLQGEIESLRKPSAGDGEPEPALPTSFVTDSASADFDPASLANEAGDAETGSGADMRRQEVQSAVEAGMAEIFADFKRGVDRELSSGDIDTRFDIGIAYREMGLLEDALVEFQACVGCEDRRIDSLHMMAISSLDLARAGDAINYLEQALGSPGVSEERRDGLNFDLGRAHEAAGGLALARRIYQRIRCADFPGLSARLQALDSDVNVPRPDPCKEDRALESFDDLVAEAEAEGFAVERSRNVDSAEGIAELGRKKRISFV